MYDAYQMSGRRVVLAQKGDRKKELKICRPVAIINVMCKLFMAVVRERINEWVEESWMIGDIQGGFEAGEGQRIICLC